MANKLRHIAISVRDPEKTAFADHPTSTLHAVGLFLVHFL